jgi:hypothetical protein
VPAIRQKLHLSPCADFRDRLCPRIRWSRNCYRNGRLLGRNALGSESNPNEVSVTQSDNCKVTDPSPGDGRVAIGIFIFDTVTDLEIAVAVLYTPALGYVMTGTIKMSDSFYMMPRLVNSVTRVNL